ncbi:MAG: zinc carboxypeptidase [Actinomycetota bacterium]|nr:zinc carboxypeptidase [Actinomycetota bacterium]
MKKKLSIVLVGALFSSVLVMTGSPSIARRNPNSLDVYSTVVNAGQLGQLSEQGFDITGQRTTREGTKVDLILTRQQRAELQQRGIDTKLTRVKGGKTVKQFAAAQAANGFEVWRSYDEPGGFRDQMYAAARQNPQIAKLVTLGTTIQGREILALKLTQGARGQADGSRPAVLYSSTQHAREWIAAEHNRRLMNHFINGWRADNKDIKNLLKSTELWFVLVANPDGYQYTFDVERLWRKNLRDNDGDGEITIVDGVDPNRNYPNHFKYDEEGSSSIMSSQTYRGPSPVSEAETQAMKGLLDRIGFEFQVNYHSAGEWLLYAEGWQVSTPTADDPIYYALSGNLDTPAIPGYHPGLSSDVLYVTNGETTDYAHGGTGALAWTPELSEGCPGCGFVFPDSDALVQAEFERNLPFAMSVAKSADDPDDPDSSLGIDTKSFYLESDDPYKEGLPGANFAFDYSYGDPQPVQVLAKRSLGPVTAQYRINGGAVQSAPTSEWTGGETYNPADVWYHQLRGTVTGTSPGDSVEVWFTGGGERSDSFTYRAVSETGNDVLVVAAEDYTGASPVQTPGPHYLDYYLDALEANGVTADVYDVDARARTAPDHLGVLNHYDGVIWYTGDDVVTRQPGRAGGNADRLANDEMLEFREYMNEGGRVAYTGKRAGQQFSGAGVGTQMFDPKDEGPCLPANPTWDDRRCLALRGSLFGGDAVNDVLEYWFGGFVQIAGDGTDDDGNQYDVDGIDDPFTGLSWGFNGPDSADNQNSNSSFVATSGILPPDEFPQFLSWPSSRWDKPGGPFEPHTGSRYAYSQLADVTYKRLTREIAVPAGGGDLKFWTSYDTEEHWDFLAVEARTVGSDDWTTLPDENGHTTQDTGDSCPAGWFELHPFLEHYQTLNADGTCSPTGSTGEWNAASGNSNGWQEWSMDLSDYAGGTVEVSIAYISDWSVQNLGVFIDDVTLPDGTTTSFETDSGGWQITGPPEGSGANANNWIFTDAAGFPVGASITTPRSLLMGYGFEGISTQAKRNAVMERMLEHLLQP